MTGLPASVRFIERDWLSSNSVLLIDESATAIVDTGYSKHAPMTLAIVRDVLRDRRLDLLLNTHLHSDHCGGNAILQRHFGCATRVPAASVDVVRRWDRERLTFDATGQRCDRFAADGAIADGQTLTLGGLDWTAIASPGHDPDSLMLHNDEAGLLISADALWRDGFGVIFPELDGDSGFAEQRAALERIAALRVRCVLPGHGPSFDDVGAALERAFSRLERLAADPERNARHAIKVLLKFMLLEHESLPLRRLADVLQSTPLIARANERFVRLPPQALADWAVADLERAGAARTHGERLLNA